ncbi:hypothetical protein AUJ67_07375 [Candidatus Desantisbacteria bacterium CG1_02_49_89]|nr:MAG: hypothetical protein AUJ67_07375 [Candidatus Desantisbacteria bacterium CG1_02_49_89]
MNSFPYTSAMIKPVGGRCNLKCAYCYYTHHKGGTDKALGVCETTDFILDFARAAGRPVSIVFQGGEPLLAGIKYYEDVFSAIAESRVPAAFSVQTNGHLLTEDFCSLFKKYNVLTGISIDGPKEINDKARPGSFERTMGAVRLMQKTGVDFNTVSVLAKHNYSETGGVYNFLKSEGCFYQQYITCFPDFYSKGWFLSGEELEGALDTLFNLWKTDWKDVFIREFDDLLKASAGIPASECMLGRQCAGALTLSSDLSLYYCDVPSVQKAFAGYYPCDLDKIAESRKCRDFIRRKSVFPQECRRCEWVSLCNNSCPEMRVSGLYRYCKAMKNFFEKNSAVLKMIAEQALRRKDLLRF